MSSSPASKTEVYFIRTGEEKLTVSSLATSSRPDGISSLEIHSSGLLTVAERREAERVLVSDLRRSVSRYIQERHYIPRLLVSALIFLLVYFFLSLVVRDPIPMVDELIAAAVGAAAFWLWAMKHDSTLAVSSKLMLDLGTAVRSAEVVLDDYLNAVEAYMYDVDQRYTVLTLCDTLALVKRDEELPFFIETLPDDFKRTLRDYLSVNDRKLMKFLSRIERNKSADKKLAADLLQAASSDHLDLSLLCFLYRASI